MKMYKVIPRVVLFAAAIILGVTTTQAQNGDQILDGIGETGMIARYVFDGDLKDWSRNNLHARSQGAEVKFINDNRFGKVLSLSGDSSAFISIPGEALTDLESISISGWIHLRSKQPGQRFFDFGKDASKHFFAAPVGTSAQEGYQALITATAGNKNGAVAPAIEANKWVHLVIVIDIPSKSMTTYVDGKPAGETKDIPQELTAVFGQQPGDKKLLYIGKSLVPGEPTLNALLRDFRIYRVPLTRRQIAGIYNNSQRGINEGSVNTTGKKEDDLPHFSPNEPQLYNTYLVKVSDVEVATAVGNLPRLPSYVPGTYRNGLKGPQVRVLWPAAIDNTAVLAPGRYTITGRIAGTSFQPKATVIVKESNKSTTPASNLKAFDLKQVSLKNDAHDHASKFIENRDKFITALAKTDPNSFLYMFRHAFGQQQPEGAKPLGVWDSKDTKLRGHATGHYLTAIAQAFAGTGYDKALQASFSQKMEYTVNTLYELSQLSGKAKEAGSAHVSDPAAVPPGPGKSGYDSDLSDAGIRTDYWNWGTGFISAYPPDQFIMLEKGAKYGGQKNSIWAPYYTLHKILAGLLDVYEVSGNKKALDVAAGMGDWVYARLSQVPTDTLIKMWNTYIAGEFGGMNEAMARMYRITGNPKHLKTAQLFDNIRVFFGDTKHSHGLAKNVDLFRGLHANQHIPQIIGSIETYRVSNNPEYYKVADNFWYKMVNDYMYSIGGVAGARNPANAECFIGEPGTLYENGFSSGGQNETCATYNMLKLTSDLFLFEQRGEYMDYYERALYNHILASVAENSPANTYHVPLRPGSVKQFGNPNMTGFTCCNGTAIESSTKLQNSIYFKSKDDQALYVNLYIPSTLDWTERQVKVEQTTSFPREDNTRLTIRGSGKFDLQVRVPGWATKGFFVQINGKAQKLQAKPGSYLKISRTWKDGDVVELRMPFQFHLDPVMDQQNIASLFYGPILLAAQEPEARKEWRKVTLDAQDISKSIKGDPQQLQFTIDDVVFKPFYESYGRHSVYLDVILK
ncbi:beta-L-arabinofuranosidase domain-containing protein [Paraflavitalea sp. CAU 1676]|uniref:beta-L-arabinofuranosidase domain-containing protein n=1 Tax=Paraflavitalea sp. CAU 1676 TaxID=3032598 RepID=UPI0023DA63F9|nr:beta-L-arabinofuranosidase domain-containing protein [Paraflavitalea sp. CAU 1676]MDF2192681.1 glycoside hydrolase family 127 protein [Paraflavitalea sp. CAU 1676]